MSERRQVVEEYFERFRTSDHERVLRCLTDDVVWDLPGFVAIGSGEGRHRSGEVHRFAYCDVFTFRGNLITRVESYLVPLTTQG